LNDGILPHSRSFEDPEAMQEERRLFYVGITRAKNLLFLSFSQNRSTYGYGESATPSRYLDDIPYGLLQEVEPVRPQRRSPSAVSYRSERWETAGLSPAKGANRKPQPTQQSQFFPGMHVQHPVWGEGLVLNSRLQDDDEIVDVHFAEIGLKRLAASLAKLEIKS